MLKNKQRLITVGVTLAAAAGAAHLMQSNGSTSGSASAPPVMPITAASASAVVPVSSAPAANTVVRVAATADPAPATPARIVDTLPVPPQDTLMPAPLPQVGTELQSRMATTTPVVVDPVITQPRRNEFGLTCGPILSASAGDGAMVSLTLTAPCRGDQQITVNHGALKFSAKLDRLGTYTVDVPALQADASFAVLFADGTDVQADVQVPLAADFERTALMYFGNAGLQIHALEFGADYGEDGHVWAGAPSDVASALQSGGGFMTLLGDSDLTDAMQAQIYTFPAGSASQGGMVRVSVEAEVTAYNCESEVAGQTIEPSLGDALNSVSMTVSMTVSMPDCTAIGEFLVLKNLLRDLKIASN